VKIHLNKHDVFTPTYSIDLKVDPG